MFQPGAVWTQAQDQPKILLGVFTGATAKPKCAWPPVKAEQTPTKKPLDNLRLLHLHRPDTPCFFPESEFPAAKLYCEFSAGHSSLLVFTSLSSLFFLVTPMFPYRRYKSPLRSSLRRFSGLVANIPRKWDKRTRDVAKSPLCAFTAAQRCGIHTTAWSSWRTLRKNTLQQDVGERLCPYEILPLVIISRSRWRANCTSSLSASARKYFTPSEFFAFLKYNGEGGGVQVLSIQRGKPRASDLVPYLIDTCPCSPPHTPHHFLPLIRISDASLVSEEMKRRAIRWVVSRARWQQLQGVTRQTLRSRGSKTGLSLSAFLFSFFFFNFYFRQGDGKRDRAG